MLGMDIQTAVAHVARRRAVRVETACEAALQGGTCGVIVDGGHAWPDARVPYGHLLDVSACGIDNVRWELL